MKSVGWFMVKSVVHGVDKRPSFWRGILFVRGCTGVRLGRWELYGGLRVIYVPDILLIVYSVCLI